MSELLGSMPAIKKLPGETDEEFEARKRKAQSGPKLRYLTDEEIRNLPPSFAEQQIAEMNFSPAQIDSMAQDPKSIDQGGYYDQVIAHKRREREKQDAEYERLYGSDKEKDPVQVALENTSVKTDEAPNEEGSVGNVLSRSNNPTGIRLSAEKAKRYYSPDNEAFAYGESTVVGNTPGGFVHFADRYSGGAASIHDAQAKTKRGLTLKQFIEEQSKGDSTGIANHKINIPAILKKDGIDVSLDMLMSDIPFLPFMNALTQSEGGVEHRKIYEPIYAQILAQNESKTNNFLQLDREQGQGDKIRELEMFPKRPPTNDEATAITDTASVNDPLVRNLTEEPPTGEQFTPLSSEELAKMTPEERNAYNNRAMDAWSKSSKSFSDLTGDKSTDQTDPITERLTADSYRDDPNVSMPASVRNSMNISSTDERIPLVSEPLPKLDIKDIETDLTRSKIKPDRRPKLSMYTTDDVTFADGQPQLRTQPAEIDLPPREETEVSPTALGMGSEYEGIFADTKPSVSAPTPSAKPTVSVEEESAPESTSMLARIGKAIRDNPEMALAGTKSIGSLLAAIGQGRGQRKEDRRVREATGRANLISALTGGRTRPQIQSETPDIGLLGRIGQGLAVAGETGLEALKQKGIQDIKETDAARKQADLERKIKADARRAARDAFKNKYTEAQIEDMKNRIALGYDRLEAQIIMDEFEKSYKERRLEFDREKEAFNQDIQNRRADLLKRQTVLNERLGDDKLTTAAQDREIAALSIEYEAERLAMEAEEHAKELTEYDNAEYERFQERTKFFVEDNKHFFNPERGLAAVYGGLNAAFEEWSKNPTSAGANAVFNMYQQMFDPATVREGDLKMQEYAQGKLNQIQAWIQRGLGTGFVLSSDVIEDMKNVADEYYNKSLETMNEQLSLFLELNRKQNLPTRELTNIENYFSRRLARPTRTTSNTTGSKDKKDNQTAKEFGEKYGK